MADHKRWQRGENAFMRHNGIAITRVSMQEAESCLNIRLESLNLYGKLHGGAYFTLADTASGALARADGRAYVTMDSHLTFIRPAPQQGEVFAHALLRHRGRSSCVAAVEIKDGENRLLATGSFTFFCVEGAETV